MKFQKIFVPILMLAILGVAWQKYGWQGIAVVVTGLFMWAMLHFTRLMQVMKRAAERPIGHVASAVMLNAKLKPGVNLMHVMALTRSIGELRSPKDAQPEVYRWTDTGGSYVDCTLLNGKVVQWEMTRPPAPADESDAQDGGAAPAP